MINLRNASLTHKLALIGALVLVMVAIPASLVIKSDYEQLSYAQKANTSLEPVRLLLASTHLSQLHRGQSAGALGGNVAMNELRKKTRQEGDAAMLSMEKSIAALGNSVVAAEAKAVQQHWRKLADAVDSAALTPAQSFVEHTALAREQIELLEHVASATDLVLYPEADGYFLQLAVVSRIEPMTESMGILRALGTAALQRKELSAEDRGRMRAELATLHAQMGSTALTLDRAVASLNAKGSPLSTSLKAAIDSARSNAQSASKLVDEALLSSATLTYASDAYLKAMSEAMAVQNKLSEAAFSATSAVLGDFEKTQRKELLAVIAITLLLGGIGSWMLWSMARSMARSLNSALSVVESVAAGDLTSTVRANADDEFGRLLKAMQRMTQQLQGLIHGVRSGAEGVATASAEIAAGNMSLSQRTEQQAASLEETASSMEELTATVRQTADNARQANQLAMNASEVAVRGGQVVREVVTTMQGISDSSKKIADIIGVIDGIAFQTNILALNAAVEAARAGEQGRGFAVVASEVRSLAQRSADAAKEIKELITSSATEVDAGTQFVDQAGRTMEEIVTSVKRVTDIIAEIATASQEQSSGIDQINGAVSSMDEVTQQNAALVEQAAAAAESLQEQAASLVQAADGFKLRNDGNTHTLNRSPAPAIKPAPRAQPPAPSKATRAPASSDAQTFVERRGPNRAKNVARLPAAKAPAPATTAPTPAPAPRAAAKAVGGDDDWESF